MGRHIENNLSKGETVIRKAKIHGVTLVPHVLAMFIFIGFITIWGALIRMFTTDLGFTNKKIIGKTGLIKTQSLNSPLNKINDVGVSSGLFGKIFGYGNIVISTSSGRYVFKGVAKPNDFKNALHAQIDTFDEERIKKQAQEMAAAMKSW